MHGWNPVVVLETANTTDAHDHHIEITIQTHPFPFLKMWLQVNPWDIPVEANRENRERLQVAWSYELYIKMYKFYLLCTVLKWNSSFILAEQCQRSVSLSSFPEVLSAAQFQSCILPHCKKFSLSEGNNCSHLKQCRVKFRNECWVRVPQQPLKNLCHLQRAIQYFNFWLALNKNQSALPRGSKGARTSGLSDLCTWVSVSCRWNHANTY